jgi:hypothetical protein
VTGLVIVYLLLWLALMVLLFAGATWLQGYIYSEPAAGMVWRAPAAGTVLTLVAIVWGYLDYRSPGDYPALFHFSATEQREPYRELWAVKAGKTVHYRLQKTPAGKIEYMDAARKPLPTNPEAIIVKEDGEEVRFAPERDAQGNFKKETGGYLRYVDPRGRVMSEGSVGVLDVTRGGLAFGYILLTLIHLGAWFLCLWLLLDFQWHHALGLAVVFWLVMTLIIMPMILSRVEAVSRQRAVGSESSAAPGFARTPAL